MRRPSPALLVDAVVVLAATIGLVPLVTAWRARRAHPFDLEWMEGGMLVHAWRLARGLPVYPEAGPEFIPYVYPPGYPALLVALGGPDGLSHALGRTVSGLATLAAAAALAVAVARVVPADRRRAAWGLGAAACYLLCYPDSGAFYDLVRPDSLAVALLGGAIAAVIGPRPNGRWGVATELVGGSLLFLAFTVKHNTAAFGVPLALGLWRRDGWRSALRFGVAAAVPGLCFTLGLQVGTEGRFVAYVLGVPGSHPTNGARIFPGTPWELTRALPVPVAVGAAWLWATAPRQAPLGRWARAAPIGLAAVATALFVELKEPLSWLPVPPATEMDPWVHITFAVQSIGIPPVPGIGVMGPWTSGLAVASLVVGLVTILMVVVRGPRRVTAAWWLGVGLAGTAVVVGALMRGHHGGYLNVFMPLHWIVCLGGGALLGRARGAWLPVAVGALVGQIVWGALRIDVEALSPRPGDVEKGHQVVELIRASPGPVLSPYAPWLAVQAGHEPSFHLIALWDIDHPGGPFEGGAQAVRDAVAAQRWGTIVDTGPGFGFGAAQHYKVVKRLPLSKGQLSPRTGWHATPSRLLAPAPRRPEPVEPRPAPAPEGGP